MNSTHSPNITQVPFRTPGAEDARLEDTVGSAGDEKLALLRREVESLTQTISDLTLRGAAAAENAASYSVSSLRGNVEQRPWMAVGVAVAVGAVIAIAIVPKSRRGFRYEYRATYRPDDVGSTIRRALERRVDTQPIVSRLERLMESISNIDPAALTASPAYDTAMSWIQTLIAGVRKT